MEFLKMKKWIWIFIVIILISIGFAIKVYVTATEPIKEAESATIAAARKATNIETITDFSLYNGGKSYYCLSGIDKDGEEIIVWIPEDSEDKIIVKKVKDGISKEEAIQKLLETKEPEEIVTVKLGVENNIPLWEIYYRSKENLINYYYIDFETGEWLKDIQNL